MPSYTFRNKETGEIREDFLSISDHEKFLTENLEWETLILGAPLISFSTHTMKIDSGFKDVLKNIKSHHRGSTINV